MRLLLLLPLLLLVPRVKRSALRARAALWLIQLAARIDIQVVIMTSQAVAVMSELAAVETLLKDLDQEKPRWPGKSTLN